MTPPPPPCGRSARQRAGPDLGDRMIPPPAARKTRPFSRRHWLLRAALALAGAFSSQDRGRGQNIVDPGPVGPTVPPARLGIERVESLLRRPFPTLTPDAAATPVLEEIVRGHPWRPFHHVIGISGHRTLFAHPAEWLFALCLVRPLWTDGLASLVEKTIADSPPYAVEGWSFSAGTAREGFDVPGELVPKGSEKAPDAFGVYAFWLWWSKLAEPTAEKAGAAHWPAIRRRMESVLAAPAPDVAAHAGDGCATANGDIAGLIGYVRMARKYDPAAARAALEPLRLRLENRLNFERQDNRPWAPTATFSKSLHIGRLSRWLGLSPELGFALGEWTDGAAPRRVKALREKFTGWWIAGGDRLVGGENFTSPLEFSRALWLATAWIDRSPARWQGVRIDVPWCRADLSFLERCALFPAD